MNTVYFMIPASPNDGFLSQIAAFRRSVDSALWRRWRPRVTAFFAEEFDPAVLARWYPHLQDMDLVFRDRRLFTEHRYFAQGDSRMSMVPADADALVLVDADTFVAGDLEDMLDEVYAKDALAGVQAHYPFPRKDRSASADPWAEVEGLVSEPLRRDHRYLFPPRPSDPDDPEAWKCPFYINFGVLAGSALAIRRIFPLYRRYRQLVSERLDGSFFAAQIGFALAVAESGARTISLPIAYNYPNDPVADATYPDQMRDIRILHYLRKTTFDRQKVFANAETYRGFMEMELSGSNALFRDMVAERLGRDYPFPAA
ncbi:MAG: hypothetical protein K5872_18025 [Rhizobiaceae bacterium]|nr:hypothetical protein [Rhizobiaceae bacterium]MCV0408124.1 hypothetical protein [Rhizobiaceae bacterium]